MEEDEDAESGRTALALLATVERRNAGGGWWSGDVKMVHPMKAMLIADLRKTHKEKVSHKNETDPKRTTSLNY